MFDQVFAPFVPFFDPRIGRPSTPMETYLRMMFLKFRYRLGYESLCREVSDSITWRRFCRIPLEGSVPNPTTLMKLTTRCGPTAVEGLNEARLVKAAAAKLLRAKQVRVDTTVVPSNVSYPTDSGVLAKAQSLLMLTTVQAALLRELDGLLERRGRGRPSPTGRPRRPGLRRSRPASRRYSGPPRRGLPRAAARSRSAVSSGSVGGSRGHDGSGRARSGHGPAGTGDGKVLKANSQRWGVPP